MNLARLRRGAKGLLVGLVWRARGVSVADRFACDGLAPEVGPAGEIAIGSRVSFRGRRRRSRLGAGPGARLSIGDRCFINSGTVIEAAVRVDLGPHCLIGDEVHIQDSAFHAVDEGEGVKRAPITIGRNVWIGNRATILPGVTIGDHSVVAAGAIVSRDVPARSLVAGTPARIVRELRCSDDFVRT